MPRLRCRRRRRLRFLVVVAQYRSRALPDMRTTAPAGRPPGRDTDRRDLYRRRKRISSATPGLTNGAVSVRSRSVHPCESVRRLPALQIRPSVSSVQSYNFSSAACTQYAWRPDLTHDTASTKPVRRCRVLRYPVPTLSTCVNRSVIVQSVGVQSYNFNAGSNERRNVDAVRGPWRGSGVPPPPPRRLTTALY